MQKQGMDTSEDVEKGADSAGSEGALIKEKMKGAGGGGGGKQYSQSNASTIRRLSAESQDFEFNKLGDIISPYSNVRSDQQLPQAGVTLASADELFYKGQLLPLQYHNNANIWSHHLHSTNSTAPTIATTNSLTNNSSPSLSPHITRDQDVRFSSSCRMDNINLGLDSNSLFDFRCSSFRSHSSKSSSYYCNYYANYGSNCSNLWDSSSTTTTSTTTCTTTTATTSGGENSSSSRDSNGSSQDSCSYSDNNKENHLCCHSQALPTSLNGAKRKQGIIMQSWRHLLNGLKRSSSNDHQVHNSSQYIQGGLKSSISAENKTSLAANQGSCSLGCGCKVQNRRGCCNMNEKPRSSPIKGSEKKEICVDNQSPTGEIKRGIRANGAPSNHNKSSKWQGYTRRIKPISTIKARLVGNYGQQISSGCESAARSMEEEKEERGSWSKRRITRKPSLDRKLSQPSLYGTSVKGSLSNLQQVSFRFHAVSSSCPASVRSSPNHSGLLSPPSSTMSTMQELHSAVQGAIAHCKQSNSAHVIAHIPPS